MSHISCRNILVTLCKNGIQLIGSADFFHRSLIYHIIIAEMKRGTHFFLIFTAEKANAMISFAFLDLINAVFCGMIKQKLLFLSSQIFDLLLAYSDLVYSIVPFFDAVNVGNISFAALIIKIIVCFHAATCFLTSGKIFLCFDFLQGVLIRCQIVHSLLQFMIQSKRLNRNRCSLCNGIF